MTCDDRNRTMSAMRASETWRSSAKSAIYPGAEATTRDIQLLSAIVYMRRPLKQTYATH